MADYTSIHTGAKIDDAVTKVNGENLVANKALVTDASKKLVSSTVTDTEISYLSGASSNIQTQLGNKLNSSDYTANDVLAKIKTVDGVGSGLDADTFQGSTPLAFALSGHTHSNYEPTLTKGNLSGTTSQILVSGGTNAVIGSGTSLSLAATPIVGGIEITSATINTVPIINPLKQVASSSVTDIELGHLSGVTSGIQSQLNSKEPTITKGNLTGNNILVSNGTNSVIGTGTSLSLASTPIVEGLEVSSLTANRALYSDSLKQVKSSNVTDTELGYLSGVTSSVQTQINNKEPTLTKGNLTSTSLTVTNGTNAVIGTGTQINLPATPIVSNLTITDLTANRALVSNTDKQVISSSVTNTELGYLSGVTSGVQSQFNKTLEEVDTIANVKLKGIANNRNVYCRATNTIYTYLANGAAYTPNDFNILTTADGGNTRWIAIQDMLYTNLQSSTYSGTGFLSRTTTTMSIVGQNFTIAPTGSSFDIYINGTKYVKTSSSITLPLTVGMHYIYFDSTATLVSSMTPWEIPSSKVFVAGAYCNGNEYTILDERHGANRNMDWHRWSHYTVGARYESGLVGTFSTSATSFTSGKIHDEDIANIIPPQSGNCVLMWYRNPVNFYFAATPIAVTANIVAGALKYDNSGTLTSVSNNQFTTNWIYATNDITNPIYMITGQAQYSSQANAEAATLPDFANFPSMEMKLIYSVVWRNAAGTPTYISSKDYRYTLGIPGGGTTATNASSVAYIPYSTISSTNVQSAIQELTDEVNSLVGLTDCMVYKGTIDCSGNPNYPAADAGWTYKVSVAGKIGGASGKVVEVGDLVICFVDSSISGDEATVGTNWNVIQGNIDGAVTSSSISSIDNSITRMDLTSGKIIQTSLATIDDNGSINIPTGQTYRINNSALTYTDVGAAASSHSHGNITNAGAIGSTSGLPVVTTTSGVLTTGTYGTLLGTTNQVNLSASGTNVLNGTSITLSLPQNIHLSATPQFDGLGLGIASDSRFKIYISNTSTNALSRSITMSNEFIVNSAVTVYDSGININQTTSYCSATNSGAFYGVNSDNYINTVNHTSSLVNQVGIFSTVGINSCGTGGSITNSYSYRADMLCKDADATITNAYFYYGTYDHTLGTVTNKWGIYLTGESKNYFSGNIAIGTVTYSPWSSSYRAIEFYGSAIMVSNSSKEINIVSNGYYSTDWKYKFTQSSTMYAQTGGTHTWYYAASGTADSTISWLTALSTDTSGNVNILKNILVGSGTLASWRTIYRAIEFNGSAIMASNTASSIYFLTNAYYNNATSTYKYKISAVDKPTQISLYNGTMLFEYAAAGEIDSDVTFIQMFKLDSGYASFGTSAPSSNYKVRIDRSETDMSTCDGLYINSSNTLTTNGTRYTIGGEIEAINIVPTGVTNSGYNMGLSVTARINSASFAGAMTSQYGIYLTTGVNSCSTGSTLTNNYGIRSVTQLNDVDCTITNGYIYYGEYTGSSTTVTNKYGLYLTGETLNYLSGILAIGGATADSKYGINITRAIDNTNDIEGIKIVDTSNTTSTGAYIKYGVSYTNTSSYVSSGQTNNSTTGWIGVNINNYVSSASHQGTLATQLGVWAKVGNHTSGTGGTVTNSYGFKSTLYCKSNDSTITSSYLYYGDYDHTLGTITNKYGIYLTGESLNYISGNLGIGVIPSSNYTLYVTQNNTNITGYYGQFISQTNICSSVGTYNNRGLNINQVSSYCSAVNSGHMRGIDINNYIDTTNHTSTLASQCGVNSVSGINSCGAGGSVTDSYGVSSRIYNQDADGIITNSYIYYGAYTGTLGTITNKWGLYLTGETKNYLSGNLYIGTTGSTWTTNYKIIEFYASSILGKTNSGTVSISSNLVSSDDVNWTYKISAEAAFYSMSAGTHNFYVAASGTAGNTATLTNALKINNSGNIGIGTTDIEAWHTNYRAIEIGYNSIMGSNTGGITVNMNCYYIDGGTWKYKTTNYGSMYLQQADGSHTFRVAPSGTIDTAITWTTAMIINNSGNIGIGTTDIEAWTSTYRAIEFYGSAILGANTGTSLDLYSNAYYATTEKYKTTAAAANYTLSNGQHTFRVAASGTIDTDITWTTALTIANTGAITTSSTLVTGGKITTGAVGKDGIISQDSTAYAQGVGGGIYFQGKYNTGGSYSTGASINAYKENATDGNYSFGLEFNTRLNGAGSVARALYLGSDLNAKFSGNVNLSYGKILYGQNSGGTAYELIQLTTTSIVNVGNSLCTFRLDTTTAVVTEAVTSDRTLTININGTNYKILLKA